MRVVTFQCTGCLRHSNREEPDSYGPSFVPDIFNCPWCKKMTTHNTIGSREVDDPTFETLEDALETAGHEEVRMDPDIPDNFEDDAGDDDESDTWTPEAI